MTNIFVYDIEGTGVLTRYDRPFQFAACIYDQHGSLLRTANLRGRLPNYVLPDPEALLVTGQTIKGIQASTLSHYQFIGRVHEEIVANSPAIIMSYNGIRYDEEILRHSFYANLRAPYVTQFDGNERMDVFIAAKTIAGIDPKALEIPEGRDEKPSFKLEGLAAANGFSNHIAHDAVGDVKATMHIARTMQKSAGRAWDACARNRSKVDVLKLLRSREPLVHIGWSHEVGKSFYQLIQPVTTDETNLNEWLCVDLEADVDVLLAKRTKDLSQAFVPQLGLSAALKVKANAMPMVFSLDTAISLGIEVPDKTRTAAWLMADQSFPGRLRAAFTARKGEFDQVDDVWHQLYSGGFFPISADQPVFARFHQADPFEKWALISEMTDPRAKHMARWLVGSEWPELLSVVDRRSIEEEFRSHLMNQKGGWTSIPSALARIEELRPKTSLFQIHILDQYQAYLKSLRDDLIM